MSIIIVSRFVVRKNTLPYIQPYSIVDKETRNVLGNYKTKQMAETARKAMELVEYKKFISVSEFNKHFYAQPRDISPTETLERRMKNPEGDHLPHRKNQRRVELD